MSARDPGEAATRGGGRWRQGSPGRREQGGRDGQRRELDGAVNGPRDAISWPEGRESGAEPAAKAPDEQSGGVGMKLHWRRRERAEERGVYYYLIGAPLWLWRNTMTTTVNEQELAKGVHGGKEAEEIKAAHGPTCEIRD